MVRFSFRQAAPNGSYASDGHAEDVMEQRSEEGRRHGRWHDNRHTLITDLAESGAGDETIRDIAGHVSKQMLKHYSHIRMEAKRRAVDSLTVKVKTAPAGAEKAPISFEVPQGVPTVERPN